MTQELTSDDPLPCQLQWLAPWAWTWQDQLGVGGLLVLFCGIATLCFFLGFSDRLSAEIRFPMDVLADVLLRR